MGGARRPSKRELQQLLLVQNAAIEMTSQLYDEIMTVEDYLYDDDSDSDFDGADSEGSSSDDAIDTAINRNALREEERVAAAATKLLLEELGMQTVTLAAALEQDSSRGKYAQHPEGVQWFEAALGWADRDFRHEFR